MTYLQSLYSNPLEDKNIRTDAAKAALAYEHNRLAIIEHKGNIGININITKDDADL